MELRIEPERIIRSKPDSLVLLGTSHVGKSTCAQFLARKSGWRVLATDNLGRHPGRPWTALSGFVQDFYCNLNDEAIHWFLRVHHENMRSVIGNCMSTLLTANDNVVLEGSALRPEYLAGWGLADTPTVCLFADEETLRRRMETASGRPAMTGRATIATDRFIERSLRENEALLKSSENCGVPLLDVSQASNVEELIGRIQTVLGIDSLLDNVHA